MRTDQSGEGNIRQNTSCLRRNEVFGYKTKPCFCRDMRHYDVTTWEDWILPWTQTNCNFFARDFTSATQSCGGCFGGFQICWNRFVRALYKSGEGLTAAHETVESWGEKTSSACITSITCNYWNCLASNRPKLLSWQINILSEQVQIVSADLGGHGGVLPRGWASQMLNWLISTWAHYGFFGAVFFQYKNKFPLA